METLINTLIQRGYPEPAARQAAASLMKMNPSLQPPLHTWLEDGTAPCVESHGYSTDGLMNRFKGMTYPAALLTLDWLMREPDKAAHAIERGIR